MALSTILGFVLLALLYSFSPAKWRAWLLFGASVLAIYALQPDLRIRWLDFLLPTATLLLAVSTWYLTRADEQTITRQDRNAALVIGGLVLGLALLRFVPADYRILVASRPPDPLLVLLVAAIILAIAGVITRVPRSRFIWITVLIAIFAILKSEPLTLAASRLLRDATGMDSAAANAFDLGWLGFSYVAFRLIHTVRDRQMGILPNTSLQEYIAYVIFFPALAAGPIDRIERFIEDFRGLPALKRFDSVRFVDGSTRILIGIGKKFVLADILAQGMALDTTNAAQVDSTYGTWLLLYGYALRLFFDFSGYSDIAIGIGILFGIRLPENFASPYTRTSITKFWQSWHITLSNWARYYVFSPLSRRLLKRKPKPSAVLVVLVAQLATMLTIGLWHGVTLSFVVWGIWHGIGLWLHKQWTDNTRKFYRELKAKPRQAQLADGIAWFITFHFVVLGWVWFALPLDQAGMVFAKLFGGQ